jgi:L-aspartate oxidase
LGSGVAGLSLALKAAEHGTVNLVTKKEDFESNTNYAQGGIAAVLDGSDCFENHIHDTLLAGAGLCHRDSVELIVTHGPKVIEDLVRIGVEFTENESGKLALGREGGHSFRRIVHAKDLTGREVENALLSNVRNHADIQVFQHQVATDFILNEKGRCCGAWVWDEQEQQMNVFLASVTILCTGGCGLVYLYTTNPPIATGDGVAMAFRAGARISNVEFVQFHPTAYQPKEDERPFLISEAVRGEGAILRTGDGTAFMEQYHNLKDLAPRDIVARAIDREMKTRGEKCCYLDVTHLGIDFFRRRFPFISHYCEENGLDLTKDWIPIVPAAHYMCGGVVTDLWGATDIPALFATGEVACTGVHGANRLASNSLLEALVFSERALERSLQLGLHQEQPCEPKKEWGKINSHSELEAVRLVHCRHALQELMWNYVGIVRSTERLQLALKQLQVLQDEIFSYVNKGFLCAALAELRNLMQVAELIILCALERKESRGLHYNIDYPDLSDPPRDSVAVRETSGRLSIKCVPIGQQ